MPKCILAEQGGKGGGGTGSSIVLRSIQVTTSPSKTSYLAGDTFNSAGMVVTASYGLANSAAILTTAEVTGSCTITPQSLVDGTTAVTISYSEGGITVTTTQAITVTHRLENIAVTTNPTKVTYEYSDTLATAGMVITATYSDGKTATVTGSCSPTALNTVGTQTITVTYAENGVSKTATFNVTVNRKSVAKPTWKANINYNGNSQSVNATSYWNNFNTSAMSIGGTTSGTNAGTYTATFTLGANYRWADGTTTALNVNWVINKVAPTFTLSATSVAIDASNLTKTITITTNSNGTLSISPTSVTGLSTLSLSGKTITITGNGSTAIASQTITVSLGAGTNWTAPANKTFTVSATYWSWGSETATANATWWSGLKSAIANMTTSELSACVGKTKSVTLTSAVLGTTTHLVRCIGYNCNRDKNNPTRNTLTFETANCMATITTFGSSNGKWIGSAVRTQCQNYYNAFPGKASVATVSIGTATAINSSQNGTPTYTDETVFLASDCEHGFPAGKDYSNGKGYAASYSEFDKQNTSKIAYQYCTTNERRIKKLGDSGSVVGYWERSLYYYNENYACRVLSDGKPNSDNYSYSAGLAPAFVI